MGDDQVIEEVETEPEAAPEAAAQPEAKPASAEVDEVRRLAGEAKERERNAQEALRAANERNREARQEREAAARHAAETKAAAEEASRIAQQMEAGMQVLADADPESAFGRMVRGARAAGGNGAPRQAGIDPEIKQKFDTLVQEVGETRRQLSAVQLREATAAVDQVATGLFKGSLAPMLDGVIGQEQFVAKVRKAVLSDPVIQRPGCDEQTALARINELGREIATEVESVGKNYHERWKARKRAERESAPPTGRESVPGASSRGKPRVKYDPNSPNGWEKFKRAHGAYS